MKALVIDRDEVVMRLIRARLEPLGHLVAQETDKNALPERLQRDRYDLLFIDPAPLASVRPIILNIRRNIGHYPYIFLLSPDMNVVDAIKAGTNDVLPKPLDPAVFEKKIANAERLISTIRRIADDSEDFPSAGGVIAKSAFNQLFLSGIDRADRYGERSFVIFITLSNYKMIQFNEGQHAADYAAAKLSQCLVQLRRQSDIIAQTEKFEFALLLQRPVYETEPVEAANRFADSLSKMKDFAQTSTTAAEIRLTLMEVPTGAAVVEHVFTPGQSA